MGRPLLTLALCSVCCAGGAAAQPDPSTRDDSAGPSQVGAVCGFAQFLPVALACSDFVDPTSKRTEDEFCASHCYELAEAFGQACSPTFTAAMTSVYDSLGGDIVRCGDRGESAGCNLGSAELQVQEACSDPTQMIASATAAGQDPRAAICESRCAKLLDGLSDKCLASPGLSEWSSMISVCHGLSKDHQCTSTAAQLQEVFHIECCGTNDCAAGPKAAQCSAQCAEAFLPYFSTCGKMVYAGQPELYAKMQGLMVTCATAAHSGQVVPTDGTDPCRAHTTCGECSTGCGWCREEETTTGQLHNSNGGYCAATCVTTMDECGRIGDINR